MKKFRSKGQILLFPFLLFGLFWIKGIGKQTFVQEKLALRDLTASLIGHAHIDLSWLWLWEETVHDVAPQTFWGTLHQMEKLPGLTFAQSQAALYEAIEKNYPDLFQEIKKKIKEGTWIPVGGMWVEPDLNMPEGESLARQLLYGKRYFLEKFGLDVKVGWNPDSFGHSFQLPQLLKKAGIDYYVFERCAPQKTPLFWWEGLDGSRVLAYVPPGWYLVDLKKGIKNILLNAAQNTPLRNFLLLYGEGDHGGGPRDTDVETILKLRNDPNEPRIELVNPEAYFKSIEKMNLDWPVIKRELNFTFPGCYTTQVETKKFNRRLENLLLDAEKFSSLALLTGVRDYYPERDLDEAWKIILRHQFHDILDGSSIGPVYDEVKSFYEEAEKRARRALDFSLETIINQIDTRGEGWPLIAFNSLPWERTEPVQASLIFPSPFKSIRILDPANNEVPCQILAMEEKNGQWKAEILFIARNVPSLGYETYRVAISQAPAESKEKTRSSLKVTSDSLENEFFKINLDPKTGWWPSLWDKKNNREVLSSPGNILEAIIDEPEAMSAWELGLKEIKARIGEWDNSREKERKSLNKISQKSSIEVEKRPLIRIIEQGPVRATIRVEYSFNNSKFIQDIQLYSGLPRIDVRVFMDWQERNVMVKAAFPVALENPVATFEIPFGAVNREPTGNEVPALKWIDLSESSGRYGVSLLNDSRYGCDVKNNVMRLSLIRGATYPDPEADRGQHELAYSLYPHPGTWKEALSFRRALEFNNPLQAKQAMIHPGKLSSSHSFLRVFPENIILTAFKKQAGYGHRGLILRLYEIAGQETEAIIELPKEMEIWEADLVERPQVKLNDPTKTARFSLKPYEIKTLFLSFERQ